MTPSKSVNGMLIVPVALTVENHVTTFHFYSPNKSVHLLHGVFTFSCDTWCWHVSEAVFPQEVINDRIRYVFWQLSTVWKQNLKKGCSKITGTYEAKTRQDTAWQESFQLAMAQGSNGKSLLMPPIHRRRRENLFPREATHNQDWLKLEDSKVALEIDMQCAVLPACCIPGDFAGRSGLKAEDVHVLWQHSGWQPLLCLQLQNSLLQPDGSFQNWIPVSAIII